jgi:uncharacterized membrane protein YeiH
MALTELTGTPFIVGLDLLATFIFGLSGGLAAVKARLDLFGVLVLSGVVGLAGGITRDVLIGLPPETFRDNRYLAAVGTAGVVCLLVRSLPEGVHRSVLVFDAMGLSLFCVSGATKALAAGLGPVQSTLLGAITGVGGGILRDMLLGEVPTVLRRELYAIPALGGAAVVTIAHEAGTTSGAFALLGAAFCLAMRLAGLRYRISVPTAPARRRVEGPDGPDG